MKLDFRFTDEDGSVKDAKLIMGFTYNNKKYIVYDLNNNDNNMYVREYEKLGDEIHLYTLNNRDFRAVKKIINDKINDIKNE